MAWWKQLFLSILLIAAGLVGWLALVPSAVDTLERAGLMPWIDRIGLPEQMERAGLGVAGRQTPEGPGRGGGGPGGPPQGGPPGGFGGAPLVTVAQVGQAQINNIVTAIGTARSVRTALLTPEASGRLIEILVQPGEKVEAGAVLARLDSAAETIAFDRAQLALTDQQATMERIERLRSAGSATEVQTREASLALRNSELSLRQAELDLARREVRAPIEGWIGFVEAEIGDQVTTTTELMRIEDRSTLLVEFLVPERHVGELRTGMPLTAAPLARRQDRMAARIEALDNRVDPLSRSLTVQAAIENPGDRLRPGMAFAMTLEFSGETRPSVDPLAIQWSRDGAFVWVLRDERTARVPVRIVQRDPDRVLVEGDLTPGETLIREGVQTLRPGMEVRIRANGEAATPRSANANGERSPT